MKFSTYDVDNKFNVKIKETVNKSFERNIAKVNNFFHKENPRRNFLPNIRHPDFEKALNLKGSKSIQKERFKNEASKYKLLGIDKDQMNINLKKNLLINSNFHSSKLKAINSLDPRMDVFDNMILSKYQNPSNKLSFYQESPEKNTISLASPLSQEKVKEKINLKSDYLRNLLKIRKKFEDGPSISLKDQETSKWISVHVKSSIDFPEGETIATRKRISNILHYFNSEGIDKFILGNELAYSFLTFGFTDKIDMANTVISFAFGAHEKASLIQINSYDLAKILLSNTKESRILEVLNTEICNMKYLNSTHNPVTPIALIKKLHKNIQLQIDDNSNRKEIQNENCITQQPKVKILFHKTTKIKTKRLRNLTQINQPKIAGDNFHLSVSVFNEIDRIINEILQCFHSKDFNRIITKKCQLIICKKFAEIHSKFNISNTTCLIKLLNLRCRGKNFENEYKKELVKLSNLICENSVAHQKINFQLPNKLLKEHIILINQWWKELQRESIVITPCTVASFLMGKRIISKKADIDAVICIFNKSYELKFSYEEFLMMFCKALLKGCIENLDYILEKSNIYKEQLPISISTLEYKQDKIFEEVKEFLDNGGKSEFIKSVNKSMMEFKHNHPLYKMNMETNECLIRKV